MWTSKDFPQELEAAQLNGGYVPPEKRSKTSPEANYLKEALECCKNQEIGIEEASLLYGIPKRTLRAKLKDSNFSVIDEKFTVIVLSVYPTEAESDLADYLQDCNTSLISLSTTEVRRLAYELICDKYKLSNFPMEKNCLLGQRWYKKFIEKYPQLDVANQSFKHKEETTTNFYNRLESFINEYKISNFRIFAVDLVELKFRASCIEDVEGFPKRRTIYTSGKAVCCNSPAGDFVPPIFLNSQNSNLIKPKNDECDMNFEESSSQKNCYYNSIKKCNPKNIPSSEDLLNIQKQIKEHLNKKLQPMSEEQEEELREKLYEEFMQLENKIVSKPENMSNDITHDIFYDWLLSFINHVKPSYHRQVLLLLPDEKYAKSFKILELGKKNGVIFLVLPPHSLHKIYPLDGFAMSLNRNLSTCTRRWLGKNPDCKVDQIPLEMLFKEAFSETINPLIAKNGFLYSGIWPINRTIFNSSELGGECFLLHNKSKLSNNENCSVTVAEVNRNNFLGAGITTEADVRKLCRVCLKEKMYMKPLLESFPSPMPNYHGKKISEITKVPVSHEDGLPSSICQYCVVQLIDTVKTKEMAVESHKKQLKLREALDRMYFEDEESENQELLSLLQCASTQINESKIINPIISKNFDINSLCRICMGEKPLMTSIFYRPQSGSLLCSDTCRRIMEVSHCQVHFHDGLSSSICPFCRTSINKASEFVQRVISSDKILRDIVAHFRAKN